MPIKYPSTFKTSTRSPNQQEMDWLYDWIVKQLNEDKLPSNAKILEFGSGITSYVISNAIPNFQKYVCVEYFPLCVDQVKLHTNNIEFVSDSWHNIPKEKYDLVFVDSSSCAPSDLKPHNPKHDRIFRDDAIHYVIPFVSQKCFFAIHDWCYKTAWLRPKEYFEAINHKLIDCIRTKHGLGIYQKGVLN